jgi:pimeloyl-ACP methyl ester carboxylesterase
MAYLSVDGDRRIYYERHRGGGRPVVLVHGWGMSARCWDTTLLDLVDNGNDVLLLDERCCGHSDKDFDDVSVDAIARDVVALADAAGYDGVVVNGWSFGGAVAAAAASLLGDRLGGLVLTGGASPRFTSADDWPYGGTTDDVEATLTGLRTARAETLRAVTGAIFHTPPGEATIEWLWEIFMQTSPRADGSLRDLGGIDQRELLRGIEAPALVVCGRHDAFVPHEAAAEAARMLPNARFVTFEESGHAPFLEEGPRYRSELVGFLNGL